MATSNNNPQGRKWGAVPNGGKKAAPPKSTSTGAKVKGSTTIQGPPTYGLGKTKGGIPIHPAAPEARNARARSSKGKS